MAFPELPVVSPSISHDFFARSSVERIVIPSALQALSLFLGSCCTWATFHSSNTLCVSDRGLKYKNGDAGSCWAMVTLLLSLAPQYVLVA